MRQSAKARGGCGRRVLLFGAAMVLVGACAVAVLLAVALRNPAGKYYVGVGLLIAGFDASAERVAADLVSDRPASKAAYYALLATAQRRQNRYDAMLETLDAGVEALPESWDAHSDRCWYGALFDAGAAVLDSCEEAISSAPAQRPLAVAHARHSTALVRSGDLEAGREAMHRAFEVWAEVGVDTDRLDRPWSKWRDELDAGRDPFDSETLEVERRRF